MSANRRLPRVLPCLIAMILATFGFLGFTSTPARAADPAAAPGTSQGAVHIAWSRTAHATDLDLVGSWTTSAWRVEIRGSGSAAGHLVEVDLVARDECLAGAITDKVLIHGSWTTASVIAIPCGYRPAGAVVALCDRSIGLMISSASMGLPANGNGRLHLRLTFARPTTHVTIRGSVRVASQAFVFGPWRATSWASV